MIEPFVQGDSQPRTWPAGHRAALCIVVLPVRPLVAQQQGSDRFAAEPYGPTGLAVILDLLADLDVRSTIAPDEEALHAFAPLLRRCHAGGHELAVAATSDDPASTDRTMDALRHVTGSAPRGVVVTSDSDLDPVSLEWPEWQLASAATDLPTNVSRGAGQAPLVTLPASPYWVDATWLAPDRPLPPSALLEAWTLTVDAVRSAGGLMSVVVHPHLIGRPGIRATLARFLDETIGSGDVWIARAGDIATWWREQHHHD